VGAGYNQTDRSEFAAVFADGGFLTRNGIDNVITNNSFSGLVLAVDDDGFAKVEAELSIGPLPEVVLAQVRVQAVSVRNWFACESSLVCLRHKKLQGSTCGLWSLAFPVGAGAARYAPALCGGGVRLAGVACAPAALLCPI